MMQKKPSLKLNFLMNAVLTLSSFVFPLITFPYVSRVLLAEGNGKVQLAISVLSYFVLLSQLGIPTYGIRVCAAVRDDRRELTRTVQELMIVQMVTTAVSYAAFFAVLQSVAKFEAERNLYLIVSVGIFLGMLGMEWLFKAMEQYTYITLRSLAFKVVSVIAMFLLVHSPQDYEIYAAICVFASYGSNLMNLTQLRKYVDLRPVGGYRIKRHIKPILILFAYVCATTVYTNLDTVMLGFMVSDTEVGYYSAAVKIKTVLVSVVTSFGAVLLPRVSYYFEQKRMEEFRVMIGKSYRFVVLLALPLAVFFMLFAKDGILFLSGPAYLPSVMPMIVIMPTVLLIGITSVTGVQVLIPTGRETAVFYASVAGAVVDLILNIILIPSLHATGAAIGTLAAEAVVLIVHLIVLRREFAEILRSLHYGKVVGSIVAAILFSVWVHWLPLGSFFTLALSSALFFAAYALSLHFLKEPMLLEAEQGVVSALRRRRSSSGEAS